MHHLKQRILTRSARIQPISTNIYGNSSTFFHKCTQASSCSRQYCLDNNYLNSWVLARAIKKNFIRVGGLRFVLYECVPLDVFECEMFGKTGWTMQKINETICYGNMKREGMDTWAEFFWLCSVCNQHLFHFS